MFRRANLRRILGSAQTGSITYDRLVKYSIYERAGVPEYWLVNLEEQTIEIFVLEEGTYRSFGVFHGEQTVPSRIVPEIAVPVAQFFLSSCRCSHQGIRSDAQGRFR